MIYDPTLDDIVAWLNWHGDIYGYRPRYHPGTLQILDANAAERRQIWLAGRSSRDAAKQGGREWCPCGDLPRELCGAPSDLDCCMDAITKKQLLSRALAAPPAAPETHQTQAVAPAVQTDLDIREFLPVEERAALDSITTAMAAKLYEKYLEGCDDFESCSGDRLSAMLREHVEKGDPVDVANFCAFLHANGQRIEQARVATARTEPPQPAKGPKSDAIALAGRQISDADIRRIFLANGFAIKSGLDDLKPYVYAAARALLAKASGRGQQISESHLAELILEHTGLRGDIFPAEYAQSLALCKAVLAEAPGRQISDEPEPLFLGHWHHGEGNLCCGTVRYMRADFDTQPAQEVRQAIFDWICTTMNAALARWEAQERAKRLLAEAQEQPDARA